MRRLLRGTLVLVVLLCASVAQATTYYVRTDGANGNLGTSNTAGGAWATITKGCQTAVAGDTVRVQAGNYVEAPSSCHNGTSGNTITIVADGVVTNCGWNFSTNSYIRIIGFTWSLALSGCAQNPIISPSGTNTGLEFWNDTIADNASGVGYNFDFNKQCTKCIFIGGSVSNINLTTGSTGMNLYGDDSFLGYMAFSTICTDGVVKQGGNRLRTYNANFSGLVECGLNHPDFFFPDASTSSVGYSTSLVEAVFGIGTATATDNKFAHQSNQSGVDWNGNVWRFNVSYNMGSAYYSVYNNAGVGGQRVRFYNSTHVNCARGTSNADCGNIRLDGGGGNVYIVNELFYQGWGDNQTTNIAPWLNSIGTATADYNLGYSPLGAVSFVASWTNQVHEQSNVDPKLNNVSGLDFTLQSASPARGGGGPLTTATSCSGTTLNVATGTGNFFLGDNSANLAQYSGALVPGDQLTVGTSTTRRVVSISSDAITVDASLTCANGDPVYYGASSTVDIGAYPYNATGYTLTANYSSAGGTTTITPNDASLVRFVVCYNDNVPYAVVNATPYTCTTPAGTFVGRVYPRYASQTLWVDASPPAAINNKARVAVRHREAQP